MSTWHSAIGPRPPNHVGSKDHRMGSNAKVVKLLINGKEEVDRHAFVTWDATSFVIHIRRSDDDATGPAPAPQEETIKLDWNKISAMDLQHRVFRGSRLCIEPARAYRRESASLQSSGGGGGDRSAPPTPSSGKEAPLRKRGQRQRATM